MALALVKLKKQRRDQTFEFLDYISYDVAKLGVEIQGEGHNHNEWSFAKIVKAIGDPNE